MDFLRDLNMFVLKQCSAWKKPKNKQTDKKRKKPNTTTTHKKSIGLKGNNT